MSESEGSWGARIGPPPLLLPSLSARGAAVTVTFLLPGRLLYVLDPNALKNSPASELEIKIRGGGGGGSTVANGVPVEAKGEKGASLGVWKQVSLPSNK